MAHFFATVLPGLECVLENEIRVKIVDAKLESVERGKVYFSSRLSVEALMVLRTADNLYRLIHRFQVGPHKIHLNGIEQEISQLDLSRVYSERAGFVSCIVNASRMGKHTYSRFEAAEAALRGVAKRGSRYRRGTAAMHDAEFRLDILHEDGVFAIRLTNAAFRYRNEQRGFIQAALRPTVAHALVWLSNPEAKDIFVDPCCGSGTILSERLAYPCLHIDGGDLSEEAVEVSTENAAFDDRVKVRRWDARRLPLDSGYADKIVTNLPFGRQIAADGNIPGLYHDVFKEMGRVLKNNGFILCLTDADAAIQKAAELVHFSCSREVALSLKGLHPTIFLLTKQ